MYEKGKIGLSFSTSNGIVTPIAYRCNSKFVENILTEDFCTAPTFSQAFEWIRDKHSLVAILMFEEEVKDKWYGTLYGHFETHGQFRFGVTNLFDTYNEAEKECLTRLLDIIDANPKKHE